MISKFFIERPILANVIAIITILLGAISLFNLPVSKYPNIVPPTIQVTTLYPGASAETIGKTVGIPIEQAVNGVENSIYQSSTSGSDGSYMLTITFKVGSNLDTGLSQVQNMISGALAQLPDDVQKQGVAVKKVSTNILQVISLYSEDDHFDEAYLSNYAIINLQYPLGRIPGIGQVKIFGAGSYSMRIWLNPERLKYYELTVNDIVDAIKQNNVEMVVGSLGAPPVPDEQSMQLTINGLGRLSDTVEFENIIIKSSRLKEKGVAAKVVRVKDLARVELSQQSYANFAKINDHKSAHIIVYTLPGSNAIEVGDQIRKEMERMSRNFPNGLKYGIYYDTTKDIKESINAVYETLLEAGILVLIVIMVFLQNWRATLVPATTVPVTIIGAFGAMALMGFSVNLMTLFALILAIGIVVDDAIVIVENASHYIEKGLTPKDAAIKAMEEMTGPVLGITLVLISVFLPAAFLPGIGGEIFRQFALVIASTAVISAINALTLKPAQCAMYLRPRPANYQPNAFYQRFNQIYALIEAAYVRLVSWMVQRTLAMSLVFFSIIALGGIAFVVNPTGFLPIGDQGYCIVITRLPEGASQPRVRNVSAKMDKLLKNTPGIKSWVVLGGFSVLDSANLTNAIATFVNYEDWEKRGKKLDQAHIIANLNESLSHISEARFTVLPPPPIQGLGTSGGLQLLVEDKQGKGLNELEKATQEVLRIARTQSGIGMIATTFSNQSPQIFLDIDRTKVQSLEVAMDSVFDALQGYLGSIYINLFNKFNQSFQVYVQADSPFRLKVEDIQNQYVKNVHQEMIPLGTLMKVENKLGSELVTHYNLYPAANLIVAPAPGSSAGEAINLIEQIGANSLPMGMSYEWTAIAYQQKQIGSQAYYIYGLSLLLVFLVLAAQYESWATPLAVIMGVPMALVGIILALVMRNLDTNIYTQVGLVLMIALSSKNAILIVEFAKKLQDEGMSSVDAAIEATRRRFRPILMTSFAFILGVIPLMNAEGAGAANQQALGTVVFGGMMASTFLAIPFVPVFYVMIQRWRKGM
ncbi:MAG: efflux RND transporter permease subunit [Methylococcales bacterium]|nr:efflux RND transporter permease subunit [Methylococcales bacterium]